MICQTGRVVAIELGSVWVETVRASTCSSCAAQNGCGNGLINKIGGGARHHVQVFLPGDFPSGLQSENIQIDDEVELSVDEGAFVRAALVVYLLPLVTLIVGAMVASSAANSSELVAVVGAVIGFIAGIGLVAMYSSHNRRNTALRPQLVTYRRGAVLLYSHPLPSLPSMAGH